MAGIIYINDYKEILNVKYIIHALLLLLLLFYFDINAETL